VEKYGYASLEQAEAAQKARRDKERATDKAWAT